MKGIDAFERSVKDSMSGYEVPYNSADWVALDKALRSGTGHGRWSSTGLVALLVTGLVGVGIGGALLFQNVDTPAPQRLSEFRALEEVQNTSPQEALTLVMEQNEEFTDEHALAPDAVENGAVSVEASVALPQAEPRQADTRSPRKAGAAESRPQVEKEVVGKPNANTGLAFLPSVTEGCPGTTVDFVVGQLPDEGIFLWNFGDGSFSNKPNPSHTFSKPGKFEVMLSHSSTSGGTIMSKPSSDLIVIHEAPEASFNARKQEFEGLVPSFHFENRSAGSSNKYLWEFGDGNSSTVAHPDHVFKKKGEYRVELTVTNAKGCVSTHDRVIRIDRNYNLEAAGDFSPNGDGVNDTFIPEALKTLGLRFHMAIHDPLSGSILYETNDPQRPWNGRVQNKGEACADGEYVWVVEMKDGERFGGSYNGTVRLVR